MARNNILKKYIPKIKDDNAQNEFYLTDIVEIYRENENDLVGLTELDQSKLLEIRNVNTKEELEDLNSS